jgi:hypothetical protein
MPITSTITFFLNEAETTLVFIVVSSIASCVKAMDFDKKHCFLQCQKPFELSSCFKQSRKAYAWHGTEIHMYLYYFTQLHSSNMLGIYCCSSRTLFQLSACRIVSRMISICDCRCSNEEITKRFSELDKDHNGVLSPQEVIQVIQDMMGVDEQRAVALIQMFDQNRDGSLDKTEFMQLWANMFGGRLQWTPSAKIRRHTANVSLGPPGNGPDACRGPLSDGRGLAPNRSFSLEVFSRSDPTIEDLGLPVQFGVASNITFFRPDVKSMAFVSFALFKRHRFTFNENSFYGI